MIIIILLFAENQIYARQNVQNRDFVAPWFVKMLWLIIGRHGGSKL